MADPLLPPVIEPLVPGDRPATLDEARALARERFKSRLAAGEQIGECACHDEDAALAPRTPEEPAVRVVGVRFRDSGQTYYFRAEALDLDVGDWVVVETGRGREAGRVVIDPRQVRLNLLRGHPTPVERRLDDDDVRRMVGFKQAAAGAIRTLGARARALGIAIKPISADYSFDGSAVVLNYSVPDRSRAPEGGRLRLLAGDLALRLDCRVDLRQVGPRDEARLLGGLGRCGRTLCCSSWLPVYPEISMNMAKTQDLPLNPTKVSGVCGRLLCCLSYENEQYKQMKAIMPRLGQTIETPGGPAVVVALQLMKELVHVRIEADGAEAVFRSDELGFGPAPPSAEASRRDGAVTEPAVVAAADLFEAEGDDPGAPADAVAPADPPSRRRRRRRGGRRGDGGAAPE